MACHAGPCNIEPPPCRYVHFSFPNDALLKERLCVLTSTDKVVVPTGTGEVLTSTEGVLTSTGGVLTSTGGALTSAEGSTSTSVLVAVFGSMVMNHHGEISAISIVKTEC